MDKYKVLSDTLFNVSREDGISKEILNQLNDLFDIFLGNPDYIILLDSASIKKEEKNKIIDEAFSTAFHKYVINFIKLLSHLHLTYTVYKCILHYEKLYLKEQNTYKVTVTTAIALSKKEQNRLIRALEKKNDKKYIPYFKTDQTILGGMIIDFENERLDMSLKTKLSYLKKTIS